MVFVTTEGTGTLLHSVPQNTSTNYFLCEPVIDERLVFASTYSEYKVLLLGIQVLR